MTVNALSIDLTQTPQGKLGSATIHAADGDKTTRYAYNADGEEILRATPTGKTLYLDDNEINTDAAGTAVTTVTRYYTVNATTVASRTNPGTLTWLADDDQKTAQLAVDATTLAVTIRKQDPFGNPRGPTPNWPNSRVFVGGTNEPTGLIHLGARMYDPTTGRFTSDDPVTETENPQQLNGYAYAYNNPTTFTDPTGLWGWHINLHSALHAVANVASIVSIVPGPIGMIAAGVSAAAYAANHEYGNAALMAAGIALAAVGAGAAVVAVRAARVVRAARAFQEGRSAVGSIRATRLTSKVAGRMWVGRRAEAKVARNGARWLQKGDKHYRGPAKKGKSGWSSNFEYKQKGHHQYSNFHVNHRPARKWAPWW
jgi:RHS repeat-associated protein